MRKQQQKHRAMVEKEKKQRGWKKEVYQWKLRTGRWDNYPSLFDEIVFKQGWDKDHVKITFTPGEWEMIMSEDKDVVVSTTYSYISSDGTFQRSEEIFEK